MKRLMVIGASVLQLPAIKKAKEMGLYVAVVDYNPQAIGISYADKFYEVSTIDEEGVYQAAKEFQADGVMTLATDMPMRSVAYATQKLGRVGISYDTAVKATDKGEMIKAFERYGVEHPWYCLVPSQAALTEITGNLTYPCIMKPTDNAGSRGVVLCHSREDLEKEYEYSHSKSRRGTVIIEEYLQGPEFSVEVMVVDGEPYVLQITDKLTTGAPHFVEMGHSQPTGQPQDVQERIKDLARRAVKAVGINVGPAHVEMILTKDGPKMVELGARMGGDCITTHLVPLSTGIDMVGCTIRLACGEKIDIEPQYNKGSAIRYFDTHHGIIQSIEGVNEAKKVAGVQQISIVHRVGEEIGEIGNSTDRVGFVIAQGENAAEAVKICERAMTLVKVGVKN